MSANQELASIVRNRAATYGLLARLYRKEVDQAFLDEMVKMQFPQNTGNSDLDAGYKLLHSYLCNIWERTLTELAIDYTRVFIGDGFDAYSAAYPLESVHTSAKRLTMGEARDEVLAIYRANGVVEQDAYKDGEDHIALELQFEQLLCGRIIDNLQAGNDQKAISLLKTQYYFLTDHLLNWVPLLLSEMKKFAETDFYQALALLTQGFLDTDEEFLRELLK